MKKVYLMKGMAAMMFGLVAASCNKNDLFNPYAEQEVKQEEFTNNFQNSVMGGQTIDQNQTWSTATSTPIKVTVDLDYGEEYAIYFYTSTPLIDKDAVYIGSGIVKSGETTTVNVTLPNGAMTLYAALYDKDSHAICKPFVMDGINSKIEFSNKETASASNVARRAVSTGNSWSVTPQNMPNLNAYTTGTLYEMEEAFNTNGSTVVNQADGSEKHLQITGSYNGSIARIQSYANQSVYVTGTWTVPTDQRITGNSVVVVGNGGKIVIPSGHMLSTNANNNEGTTGMIYVMPGGTIEGAGQLQFSNGTQTFSYNGGTITVANININGGTLYNAGVIGKATNTETALEGPSSNSLLVNLGQAYFTQVSGAGMSIHNACNIYVTGDLALGNSSKMDNGSYIECGTLHLNGSNNGGIVLNMGNAAYMNCKGDISVNNFGVWGPTSNNGGTINRAIFKIGGCSYCNYTSGDATQFMLDNTELILPDGYPTGVDYGYNGNEDNKQYGVGYVDDNNRPTCYAKHLLYGWFNGYTDRLINGDNYDFKEVVVGHVKVNDYYEYDETKWVPVWKNSLSKTSFNDDSRATCIYGTSPSYSVTKDESENCGITFEKEEDPTPTPNYVYYAFEDLGTTDDFDFNDVVIRVSTPDTNGTSTVQLMATGGTLSTVVTYGTGDNIRNLGSEVHTAIGASSASTMVNTGSGETKTYVTLGTIENLSANTDLTTLPLGITVTGNNGQVTRVERSVENNGKAPLVIVVNGYPSGENAGKWFWPKERTNISTAYPDFGAWGANATSNANWYQNYADGSVYTW